MDLFIGVKGSSDRETGPETGFSRHHQGLSRQGPVAIVLPLVLIESDEWQGVPVTFDSIRCGCLSA